MVSTQKGAYQLPRLVQQEINILLLLLLQEVEIARCDSSLIYPSLFRSKHIHDYNDDLQNKK
jgi:hypothetical protein